MSLLCLTILIPLVSFILLAFSRGSWLPSLSAIVGVGSVGLAALITILVGIDFFKNGCVPLIYVLWNWIHVENFSINITLILDRLSFSMLSVVTGVGFLIHMFASWYMKGEEGYSRFFSYTNLFIASMIVLVLSDNLLLMYLGWEGVGLCSYLLIGFYYTNADNGKAAIKAFIITRIGDIFLAFALFILYNELGTLNFRDIDELAPLHFSTNSHMLKLATLMLLGGAVGKSAQLPLQTWLADAMAGPTPVSALIHSATMVTAGVYLIARTYNLFIMEPEVLHLVGIVGATTLLLAGFMALVQTDIKRVLAYSTMGQIGYMFLALGVQALNAAIFHLMTHAFFKSLLFLASGSVILACHHEQNIFKMGGLYKSMPMIYFCFLIGGAALSATPFITASFYSKDEILIGILENGNLNLMIAALIGGLLTSIYIFRMIFIVFHGKENISIHIEKSIFHYLPLIILIVFSTSVGSLAKPSLDILLNGNSSEMDKTILKIISGTMSLLGICVAAWLWLGKRKIIFSMEKSILCRFFYRLWNAAWGFDWLYEKIFVNPWIRIAHFLKRDPLSILLDTPVLLSKLANKWLVTSQNGYLRWYIASMGISAILLILILII